MNTDVLQLLTPKVGNATARALVETTQKTIDVRDHYSAMFWAVIAPINNVAVMEIKTAYDMLSKDKSMFRHDVKKNAKETMRRIDKYDNAVVRTMRRNTNGDRSQYWMDYTDEHYESLRHDIEMFNLSVLQVLTKHDEPKRDIKTHIVTSHALLNYAIGMFDAYFEKVRQIANVEIEYAFVDARLSYVMSSWEQVVNVLCKSEMDIDIDNDKNVRLAFSVIEQHSTSPKRIRDIGDVAISYNPDVVEDIKYVNPMNTTEGFEKTFEEVVGATR